MRKIVFILTLFIFANNLAVKAQLLNEEQLKQEKVYVLKKNGAKKSKDTTTVNPVRLAVKCKKCDSLPEEIFAMSNLQELTCRNCKLTVINKRIGELKNLQYLDVSMNRLLRLPEELGQLTELKTLIINRNKIESLPESIGNLKKLTFIDAWSNPLYILPQSIKKLANTLTTIDLRQIPLRDRELEEMEKMLPKTDIKFTSVCECENDRD